MGRLIRIPAEKKDKPKVSVKITISYSKCITMSVHGNEDRDFVDLRESLILMRDHLNDFLREENMSKVS